ncbi:cell cycle histidine kinase CckA [Tepidamorphus sp. 3E244]|uniref:cell cycle histidine kinase CckA n=1 Tax=Tepidamorphus sp. 3E244 TaxID=3385498 RepID=UPI0038FC9A4E
MADIAQLDGDGGLSGGKQGGGSRNSIGWVLLLAGALMAVAVSVAFLDRETARPVILGLLAILAVAGVFLLFALAVGMIRPVSGAAGAGAASNVAESVPEGILVSDRDGRILQANAAYRSLTGAEGLADVKTVERFFAGERDISEQIYRLSQAAAEGRPHQEDLRIERRVLEDEEPDTVWYRVRVQPLVESGSPSGSKRVWQVSDITRDRERQENAFVELQGAIDYLDHAPAGFLSIDGSGNIVYINATLAAWLGRDLGDFERGTVPLAQLVSGDGAALINHLAPAPGEVRTETFDLDLLRRNGKSLPVRLVHKVAYQPDGTAIPSRTLVLNRSATGDEADPLRAVEVRFARFFNSSPFSIATIDAEGRTQRTNAPFAQTFGALLANASEGAGPRGASIYDTVAEADQAALREHVERAVGGVSDFEPVDVQLAGQDKRKARFFVTPVGDAEGDGESAIVYALDITEQKALEEQFAQSQKMQAVGQLAGGIAHDFNNVLTAIIGFSDLLLASHSTTDPSFNDIKSIKENAQRAAGLVRQLLAFSRRQTLRPQVLRLNDAISELAVLLRRLIGAKVKLELGRGRDLWPVKADLTQLEQVIINLAVNARDAMPDGGELVINTRNVPAEDTADFNHALLPEGDYVLTEVHDTGTGIPRDIMDKIFDPFFSTKEVGKGTGLGLSTVYGIVKQTGGFIFCDSEVGAGTTFRIFLPRCEASDAGSAGQVAKAEIKDLTGQGAILIVEDEDAVRAFAARALSAAGYTVVEAATGLEALDRMAEMGGKVDLVLSDVVMPEMDGPTMLREMRKTNKELKIIFVSGYADDAFKRNLDENETFHFLPKPFNLKTLAETVKTVMSQD